MRLVSMILALTIGGMTMFNRKRIGELEQYMSRLRKDAMRVLAQNHDLSFRLEKCMDELTMARRYTGQLVRKIRRLEQG